MPKHRPPVRKKYTAAEIVHAALHWGEENITAMIDAHASIDGNVPVDDEHVAYLLELRRQMRAYRKRRVGVRPDPFKDCITIDAMTGKEVKQ